MHKIFKINLLINYKKIKKENKKKPSDKTNNQQSSQIYFPSSQFFVNG
jgi:hypothetical protein